MIIGAIIIIGIGISLFVFLHLLRQNGVKLLSRRIALSIQLLWLVRFGLSLVKGDNEIMNNPYLVIYDQTLYFLDGLLVWLYIRALLQPEKSLKKIWIHFLPFAIVFLYSTYMAFFEGETVLEIYNEGIRSLGDNSSFVSIGDVIYISGLLAINIIYLVKSVKITNSYNQDLKENLSTIDHLTINWVKKFQRLWILFFLIPILVFFLNYIYPVVGRIGLGNVMIVLFILLSIVFNSFLLEQVYKPVSIFRKQANEESSIDNSTNDSLLEKLKDLLLREKYHLDDELSLGSLAQYMGLKPTELTSLIKYSEFENFYDLINSYRIDEVKRQLKESSEQIIQIAYQNGFRSKSTFNKIFKEKTGMTPKEYRLS